MNNDLISREVAIKYLTKARIVGDNRPMTEIFAEIPSANQWISGDNLPKESGQYIVTNKDGRVFVDTWCGTGWWECFPIAWRPLPEPYVEVEE